MTTLAGDRWAVGHALAIIAAVLGSFFYRTLATRMCALLSFLVSHKILLAARRV